MGTGDVPHDLDGGDRLRRIAGEGILRRRPVRHDGHRSRRAHHRRRYLPAERDPQGDEVNRWSPCIVALALAASRCESGSGGEPYIPPVIPPGTPVVLVGAGDIADCSSDGDEATALLLDSLVQD